MHAESFKVFMKAENIYIDIAKDVEINLPQQTV